MIEYIGNIWDYHVGGYVVIPTNGDVKNNGEAVMGKGLALEATDRFPALPRILGEALRKHGNRVFIHNDMRLVTFPTKHSWTEPADMELIVKGLRQLTGLWTSNRGNLYLPKLGCGLGKLDWAVVRRVMDAYLTNDNFIVIL